MRNLMITLFETVHGSHLYGLAHAGSDRDRFAVTLSGSTRAHHRQVGDDDLTEMGLSLFLLRAAEGSHQSVEALFSPHKVWTAEGDRYRPMIESMRVTGGAVFAKYERTITKFAFGNFKRRRHAARLALNLSQLRDTATIRPVLSSEEVRWANLMAALEGNELLRELGLRGLSSSADT